MKKATGKKKPRNSRPAGRRRRNPAPRRQNGRNANQSLTFFPVRGSHLPLPMEYYTRLTASGSFYTGSGAGTGDYLWNFKLNSIAAPFANVTTGITWNSLTPATYEIPGASTLFSATAYSQYVVYGALFEFDATPQSVIDSVVVTLTPSNTANIPANIGKAADKPFTKQMTFASGRVYRMGDYPFKARFSAWHLLGLPKYLFMNDVSGNFVGGFGSSLTDPPVSLPWVMNLETGDNSTLNVALECRVRITYDVKCYGLKSDALNVTEDVPKLPRREKVPTCSPRNFKYPRVNFPPIEKKEPPVEMHLGRDPRIKQVAVPEDDDCYMIPKHIWEDMQTLSLAAKPENKKPGCV